MKHNKNFIIALHDGILRSGIFLLLVCVLITDKVYSQEDLDVIKNKWLEFSDAQNALYHYFSDEAYDLLSQRSKTISGYNDLSDWKQRQAMIKETLNDIIGPFPARTPLNALITKTLTKDKFRVEHVIFESQPGFYVSSSLFIPARSEKRNQSSCCNLLQWPFSRRLPECSISACYS